MPNQYSKLLEPTKSIRTKHFHLQEVVTNCVTNQSILNYKFNKKIYKVWHIFQQTWLLNQGRVGHAT